MLLEWLSNDIATLLIYTYVTVLRCYAVTCSAPVVLLQCYGVTCSAPVVLLQCYGVTL